MIVQSSNFHALRARSDVGHPRRATQRVATAVGKKRRDAKLLARERPSARRCALEVEASYAAHTSDFVRRAAPLFGG
jgi:hypothetical protein